MDAYARAANGEPRDGDPSLSELEALLLPYFRFAQELASTLRCDRVANKLPIDYDLIACGATHKRIAKMCSLRARLQMQSGNSSVAFEAMRWGAEAARQCSEIPSLLGSMIHIAADGAVLMGLRDLLEIDASRQTIDGVSAVMDALGPSPSFRKAVIEEAGVFGLILHRRPRWWLGDGIDDDRTIAERVADTGMPLRDLRESLEQAFLAHILELIRRLPDEPAAHLRTTRAVRDFNAAVKLDPMFKYLEAFTCIWATAHTAFTKTLAVRRMIRTLCSILDCRRDLGWVPREVPNLGQDSIDPFTGRPLKLVVYPESILLYSCGPNRRDDGGISLVEATRARRRGYDIPLVLQLR